MERRVLGESLSGRLNERVFRRPRIGLSPSFYSRWGLEDPWLSLGSMPAPESVFSWSFLSDRDYKLHLRRLGFQRWRREKKMKEWLSQHGERMLDAASRRSGLKRKQGFSAFAMPSFNFPAPQRTETQAEDETDAQQVPRRTRRDPMRSVDNPWFSGPRKKRREFPSENEKAGAWVESRHSSFEMVSRVRPLDQVTARLVVQQLPQLMSSKAPVHRSSLRQVASTEIGVEKHELQTAQARRRIRQLRKQLGPVSRLIESELEREHRDHVLRPSSIARSRMGTRTDKPRGLRPVLTQSPLMRALEPISREGLDSELLSPDGRRGHPSRRPMVVASERSPVNPEAAYRLSASPVRNSAASRMTRGGSDQPPGWAFGTESLEADQRFVDRTRRDRSRRLGPVRKQSGTFVSMSVLTPDEVMRLDEVDSERSLEFFQSNEKTSSGRGRRRLDATRNASSRLEVTRYQRPGSVLPRVVQRPAEAASPVFPAQGLRVTSGPSLAGRVGADRDSAAVSLTARGESLPGSVRERLDTTRHASRRLEISRTQRPGSILPRVVQRPAEAASPVFPAQGLRVTSGPSLAGRVGADRDAATVSLTVRGESLPGSVRERLDTTRHASRRLEISRTQRPGSILPRVVHRPSEAVTPRSMAGEAQPEPTEQGSAIRVGSLRGAVSSPTTKGLHEAERLSAERADSRGNGRIAERGTGRAAEMGLAVSSDSVHRRTPTSHMMARMFNAEVAVSGSEGTSSLRENRAMVGDTVSSRAAPRARSLLSPVSPEVLRAPQVTDSDDLGFSGRVSPDGPGASQSGLSGFHTVASEVLGASSRDPSLEASRSSRLSPVWAAATRGRLEELAGSKAALDEMMGRLLAGRSRLGPLGYARLVGPSATILSPGTEPGTFEPTAPVTDAGSRPMAWADARIPPSAASLVRLKTILSSMDVFGSSLDALLRTPELARVAATMSGAELRGRKDHRDSLPGMAEGVRVGRYVARTHDGRFISSAWTRESARRSPQATAPVAQLLDPASMEGEPGPGSSEALISGERLQRERGEAPMHVSSSWGRSRTGYVTTLDAVNDGRDESTLPTWARRASGESLVHENAPSAPAGMQGELITSLARATSPEEVISLMAGRGGTVASMKASLSAPVLQVIEQIRTEAHRVDSEHESGSSVRSGDRDRSHRRGSRSTTRVVRGFTSLAPSARSPQGASADKVTRLATRLQALIAVAEGGGDRSSARRQVRMAEDSAAATSEGQGAVGGEGEAAAGQADIDALGREVLSAVTRELEMRRERRMEDGDERDFWW